MGKSLFMTGDGIHELQGALDNFYIAKLLYDAGKPFPSDRPFYGDAMSDRYETLFFDGVGLLFGSAVCYEDRSGFDNSDEPIVFSVRIPLVEEWTDLVRGLEGDKKIIKDQEWFMNPIKSQSCSYFELETKAELTTYGLRFKLEGYHGMFHSFIEGLVSFLDQLQQKVEQRSKGGNVNVRDTYRIAGRHETSERRKAV